MKKVIDVKEIMIILISVVLITVSTAVFATDVFGENNTPSTIDKNEYVNAQNPDVENTNTNTNTNTNKNTNTNTNTNTNNTVKKYNTNNSNKTDLPQTGIEDYNIGIVLIICVASAIYAYKKVGDYRNI